MACWAWRRPSRRRPVRRLAGRLRWETLTAAVAVQNNVYGIAGKRGSGKSTVLKALAATAPRVLVWDLLGEHRWCPNRLRDARDITRFIAWAHGRERFAARVVPEDGGDETFDALCDLAYREGRLLLVVEEVAMVSKPNWLPASFDKIVRLGRHRGVSVAWTTQRLSEVARRLTSTTDAFLLFFHHEPRDVEAIQQRCGVTVADTVSRLGRHNFVSWEVATGRIAIETLSKSCECRYEADRGQFASASVGKDGLCEDKTLHLRSSILVRTPNCQYRSKKRPKPPRQKDPGATISGLARPQYPLSGRSSRRLQRSQAPNARSTGVTWLGQRADARRSHSVPTDPRPVHLSGTAPPLATGPTSSDHRRTDAVCHFAPRT